MKIKKIKIAALILSVAIITTNTIPAYAVPLPDEHIVNGYEDNEPLFVHTPVISPVSIKDENGNPLPGGGFGDTQLVSENTSARYQLRLDTDYIMHWDSKTHREILGYGDSGEDPSKYDKYTQDKWMKLPFEVLYDGVFYELDGSGYTDWIQIKRPNDWQDTVDNHWIETPFYIPSYAREMGDTLNPGSIFYKVEAINVDGDLGEHYDEEQADANTNFTLTLADDGAMYVATYEIPIQLSGWIYDFTITGSTNGAIYENEGNIGQNIVAFSTTKSEKKTGAKNRLGGNIIRYLLDGTITDAWQPKNTITLTDGKSHQFKKMGAAWKGQTFSFHLKTIANLTDHVDGYDYLTITPTFSYVDENGNKVPQSMLKIFYHDPNSTNKFIEYGTLRDAVSGMTNIGKKMQEGAYYTEEMTDTQNGGLAKIYHFGDWATFTTDRYNLSKGYGAGNPNALSTQEYMSRNTTSYSLSSITLQPSLRLFSGEWEQLHFNTELSGRAYDTVLRYSDLDNDGYEDGSWSVADTIRFRESMQSWYGEYYIPADLYVVDLNKHPGFDMDTYMGSANGGLGITEDDAVFEQGGYLIVNFKIVAYKDGVPHIQYMGLTAGSNMWQGEGFDKYPAADDPTPIPEFVDGDVIVIDMKKSTKDSYSPALFNVN